MMTEPKPYSTLAVLGAGSWGTALASVLARAGAQTRLWARDAAQAAALATTGENARYLPGVPLPKGVTPTSDLASALRGAEAVLIVVPSTACRQTASAIADHLAAKSPVVVCAKGVEAQTGLLMSQVAAQELPGHPIGCLSGPTFARELALGHPTAATLAFHFADADRAQPQRSPAARLAVSLTTGSFRPYVSDDPTGVEVGGAVKNVIAIACGMMAGAGLAENTRAALITRGLGEITRLAMALGGRRETVAGLSGLGDLVLTCGSTTSRNMSLGTQLGQGLARADCFDGKPVVVEGEANVQAILALAQAKGVELPICETVAAILHEGADLRRAFADLWARPLKSEASDLDLAIPHQSPQPHIPPA